MNERRYMTLAECVAVDMAFMKSVEIVHPPVVCLPLMTKPASNPHDGKKYLPEVWRPE